MKLGVVGQRSLAQQIFDRVFDEACILFDRAFDVAYILLIPRLKLEPQNMREIMHTVGDAVKVETVQGLLVPSL